MTTTTRDTWQGASHRNMVSALAGPLREGAVETTVTIDDQGRAAVGWTSYEPILLAAPRRALGAQGVRLEATVQTAGTVVTATFAPHTEASAFLLLYRPTVDDRARTAAPFAITLRLVELGAGPPTEVPAAELAERIELALFEGVLGRITFLLGAEKARLRRQARMLPGLHRLTEATGPELDRRGVDLDVPRFADRLTASGGTVIPQPERESDAAFRARLAVYRPWLQPSPAGLAGLLHRPGLQPSGAAGGYDVDDRGERFALSLKVIAAGDPALRVRFLEHVRQVHLLLPANNPYANTVHARRFVPAARRQADAALRGELRRLYTFTATTPGTAALGRPLALALVRVARCREVLTTGQQSWPCSRTQDLAEGSRYELGLAADLQPLSAGELDMLATRHKTRVPPADPQLAALLQSMRPRPAAEDPDGRWLLEPCGLRTVHRLDNARLLVSNLPFAGLVIDGPVATPVGAAVSLEARYHARLDPGPNAVLADGLAAAQRQWTAAQRQPWTVLTAAEGRARWDAAPRHDPAAPAMRIFRAAGLSAVNYPAPIVARLKEVRPEMLTTLVLPAPLSQAILAGQDASVAALRALTDLLRAQWLTAALPLVTGAAEVALVAAVTRLPEAGSNLSRRRATGFRWYAESVTGMTGELTHRTGPATSFTPASEGLTVAMVLGYARRGLTAPYEIRVTLPSGAMLNFSQYELLMNVLDHAHPLGVGVNTAEIRRNHIDVDGDGDADPLSATLSRSYRAFRPRRIRTAGDVFSPETPGLQVGVHSTIGVDTILAQP